MAAERILVPHQHKIHVIPYGSVLYFRSNNSYCHVYLADGRSFLLARSLSRLEEETRNGRFLRISQSFLVNVHYITAIDKSQKVVVLSEEQRLPFTISLKRLSAGIMGQKDY